MPATSKSRGESTSPSSTSVSWSLMVAQAISVAFGFIVLKAAWEFENVQDSLAFYGVYHANPWNQVVHFVGVPGILFSALLFFVHVPLIPANKNKDNGTHWIWNYGFFYFMVYVVFYYSIDPVGATLYMPFLIAMYGASRRIYTRDQQQTQQQQQNNSWMGTRRPLQTALILHALSWWMQIQIGHSWLEGAQPASFQSLGGALTVAPLFAFYEGLWACGLRPDLQQQTLELVAVRTRELCAAGTVPMRVCATLDDDGEKTESEENARLVDEADRLLNDVDSPSSIEL